METEILIYLCLIAFCAGFVDSIVGGGGLIQTPLSLVLLPHLPIANVLGTLKVPAFCGTAMASYQYVKKVKLDYSLLIIFAIVASVSAFIGSQVLIIVNNDFMKPVMLIILVLLAIYTIFKKDFGASKEKYIKRNKLMYLGILICVIVGFYDGFIGPATGTFFIVGFVSVLGMDFLKANAHAKLINLATNFGSFCLFLIKGKIIWAIALPMAVCNASGGCLGAKFAIQKGNKVIRYFFISIIFLSIARFGYEVWKS